jgi:hypothetical protein
VITCTSKGLFHKAVSDVAVSNETLQVNYLSMNKHVFVRFEIVLVGQSRAFFSRQNSHLACIARLTSWAPDQPVEPVFTNLR